MECRFWLFFFAAVLLASVVTTIKILYEGAKEYGDDAVKVMLEAIARRAYCILKKYFKV